MSTARELAIEVNERRVMRQAELFRNGIPANSEAWIGHAVAQQWVVEDADGLLRAGPVSPYLPEPVLTPGEARCRWDLAGCE